MQDRKVGIVMSFILSTAMGIVSSLLLSIYNPDILKTSPAAAFYAMNILLSNVVGLIVALCLPLGKLGLMLARKANAVPPSMKFILINAIPNSVGNSLIIGLVMSLVGVMSARMRMPAEALSQLPPFPVMWLSSWIKLFLPTLLISYVISILVAPLIARLAGYKKPEPQK